jgi:anti-sigma B factor antagonist
MEMKEQIKDDILIVKLEGELLGGSEGKLFQDRLYQAIRDGQVNMIVDMEGIKWMNSSGLGIIMAGLSTLRGSGGDLRLAGMSERVRRPIEVTRLDSVIMMYKSVEDAIKSYDSGG